MAASNQKGEVMMIVADGMGGHRGGEIASTIATEHLIETFDKKPTIGAKEEALKWLQQTVTEANTLIYKYTEEHPESLGMGTTLVVALLTKTYLLFANIGDSRGYVYKDKQLHQITTDHTLVNLLLKSGEITAEEARNHPRKNVLMRALGATVTVEMDIIDVEPDVSGILLCSDGLTNMLDDEQISRVLAQSELDINQKLQKLIYKCNNRGGNDNISIAYLEKGDIK